MALGWAWVWYLIAHVCMRGSWPFSVQPLPPDSDFSGIVIESEPKLILHDVVSLKNVRVPLEL